MAQIADLLAAGRTYSFEFFPPKTDSAQLSLGRAIGELEPLAPSFVSVTYGAGGSTRQRTHAVVSWMRKETTLTPMAHLTCQGHVRSEIRDILNDYAADGVENILALGGDVPTDGEPAPSDYTYASDLLEDVVTDGRFSVGVAAHPELHPRSPDRATDRKFLGSPSQFCQASCQSLIRIKFVAWPNSRARLSRLGCQIDLIALTMLKKFVVSALMPRPNCAKDFLMLVRLVCTSTR